MFAGEVLVVRPGALGDAVLTLPAVRALLGAGARRVTVLGNPASWGFLRPDIRALRVCDVGSAAWLGLFAGDPGGPEDGGAPPLAPAARRLLTGIDAAVVYLGGAARERVAANLRAAGVADVRGAEPPRAGAADGRGPGADGAAPDHAARRLLRGLASRRGPVGGDDVEGYLVPPPLAGDALLAPTEAELAAARRRLPGGAAGAGGRPLLALHPGSGGAAKCWPAERFAALAVHAERARGLAPVLLFGPADAAVRRAFGPAVAAEGLEWTEVAGRPLREVLAVLALARAYVGNDSGVTHLAARACPTLALFGPSEPAVWRPLGREVAVLRAPERRMDALAVPAVAAALGRLLDDGDGSGCRGP